MSNTKLNSCKLCGREPIIEHWGSGGLMYMVKCNNPDCPVPSKGYPNGRNLENVIEEWNRSVNQNDTSKAIVFLQICERWM